eukprot:751891-Rhodomonas_salina.1
MRAIRPRPVLTSRMGPADVRPYALPGQSLAAYAYPDSLDSTNESVWPCDQVAQCYGALAMVYYNLQDLGNALSYQQKAIVILEKISGWDDPEVAMLLRRCYAMSGTDLGYAATRWLWATATWPSSRTASRYPPNSSTGTHIFSTNCTRNAVSGTSVPFRVD